MEINKGVLYAVIVILSITNLVFLYSSYQANLYLQSCIDYVEDECGQHPFLEEPPEGNTTFQGLETDESKEVDIWYKKNLSTRR
ncbi:MAG: hypothetical protein ACOCTT_01325 [archaeon]